MIFTRTIVALAAIHAAAIPVVQAQPILARGPSPRAARLVSGGKPGLRSPDANRGRLGAHVASGRSVSGIFDQAINDVVLGWFEHSSVCWVG